MKRLLLPLLILISSFAFSQKIETSYQVQSGRYNKYTQEWTWSELKQQEIEIKLDGTVVYIYNNSNTVIRTYEDLGEKKDYDKDGDKYTLHSWKGYDDKDRKCLFMMTYYESLPIVVYSVIYGDTAFRFYMRNNKLSDF